jgi:hypothetical protein
MDKDTILKIVNSLKESYDNMKKETDKRKENGNIDSNEINKYDGILQGYKIAISDIETYLNIATLEGNKDLDKFRSK